MMRSDLVKHFEQMHTTVTSQSREAFKNKMTRFQKTTFYHTSLEQNKISIEFINMWMFHLFML